MPPPLQVSWVPPDGGWAWVIAVCSFLLQAMTIGTQISMSVLYVSWLETFVDGRGITSWIISISMAVTLGMSPIPAALANRYGFRVMVVVGGIVTSAGYIVSYFATSVAFLVVSIGLVAGIGSCCAYMSAVAIVFVYFDRRRPIGMGIGCAGVGFGALVIAPLLDYLENVYTWRGAILIVGATSLHICVCGLLIRPINPIQINEEIRIEVADSSSDLDEQSLLLHGSQCTEMVGEEMDKTFPRTHAEIIAENMNGSLLTIDKQAVANVDNSSNSHKGSLIGSRLTHLAKLHCSLIGCDVSSFGQGNELSNSRRSVQDKSYTTQKDNNIRPYSSLRDLDSKMKSNSHFSINLLSYHLGKKMSLDAIIARSVKHLDRIILLGSVPSHLLQSVTIDEQAETEDEEIDNFEGENNDIQNTSTFFASFKRAFTDCFSTNIELLKDPMFFQFGISNLLTCLSFVTPQMYLVDRAVDVGLSRTVGAMLVAISGVGSLFGRFSFGVMTYRLFSDRLMIYIVVLFLAGVFTMVSPLCGDDVILHSIYAFLIGYFLGGYGTLVAVTTADVMGLTKATNSYGLLLTFMGLATLIGPPFAGLLFDWTQSYTVSYVLYGFFLICSMLMLIPIYCIRRRKKREQEQTVEEMSSSPLPHKQEHTENQTFQEAHKVT